MLYNLQKFCQDYAAFSTSELFQISHLFKLKQVEKGQIIFAAGQLVTEIYFLNSGVLKWFRDENYHHTEVKFYMNPTFLTDLNSIQSHTITDYTLIAMSEVEIYHADFEIIHLLMLESESHNNFFTKLFKDHYLFNLDF